MLLEWMKKKDSQLHKTYGEIKKEEKDAQRNGNNGALNLFQDREHNRDSVKNSQFALCHISVEAADIQSQKNLMAYKILKIFFIIRC